MSVFGPPVDWIKRFSVLYDQSAMLREVVNDLPTFLGHARLQKGSFKRLENEES